MMTPRQLNAVRSRRASQGFTLLEVMIALAVGGIALSSMYAIGAASTRHFREQQRISATQTSLRAAMDQLKHDFQRAGFFSTPNAALAGENCGSTTGIIDPTGALAGIAGYMQKAQKPESLDPGRLNESADAVIARRFEVDRVWLSGNYATSGEYPGISIATDQVTVTIPQVWQGFQRDFTEWSGAEMGNCNPTAFAAAFPVGRLVRLHGLNERYFYARISSAECRQRLPAVVVLRDPVPPSCNLEGGWIAPVSMLRYQVEDSPQDEASRIGLNRNAVLRRSEVKPDDRKTKLTIADRDPVEDRSVLDYVVNFTVGFMMHTADGTRKVNMMPEAAANVLLNPERVRGVILDLAAPTSEHEPEFSADVPRAAFKVHSTVGAARVRRAHAELLLPNLANRGL